MVIALSLVRAKLILFDPKADRRDFVCLAVSCGDIIVHGRLVKADALNESYLSGRSSEGDFTRLRKLARLLLCPKHKDELCNEIARAWEYWYPDNDLFRLFNLNRNPLDWSCLAEHCDKRYDMRRRRAMTIMETLSFNEVAKSRLSDEKREQLVRELVSLLHCDNHLQLDGIRRISDEWNKQVTNMIQRQMSEDTYSKKTTPKNKKSKNILNQDITPQEHESKAEAAGRDSGKDLPDSRSGSGGSGHSSSPVARKSVLKGKPTPSQSESLNSGLLSPVSSAPSSPERVVSTAEQSENALLGPEDPGVSTTDNHRRHSSSSRRTASPFANPFLGEGTQAGGNPTTNGFGSSLSAPRTIADPGSHSSSDIRVTSQEPHDSRPSSLRETQSYPNMHSGGPTRVTELEGALPTQISPISPPLEEEEIAIFANKSDKNFEPREIDMKLLRYIRSTRAEYGKMPEPSSGDVYVLRNPAWPNHVKIGESGRDVDNRIAEIQRVCEIECLEQVLDTEQDYFPNYKLVEKLCHKELQNFRKNLHCKSCRTKKEKRRIHEEWFQVTPEIAVRTVQKWRKWMLTSPYNDNGHLVPWWRHKANGELIKAQPLDAKGETIDDDDSRHERWSRWLESPTVSERADFEIKKYLFHPRPRRKSLWNTIEENLIQLLAYVIVVGFLCGPKNWILIVLSLLLVLRDWS